MSECKLFDKLLALFDHKILVSCWRSCCNANAETETSGSREIDSGSSGAPCDALSVDTWDEANGKLALSFGTGLTTVISCGKSQESPSRDMKIGRTGWGNIGRRRRGWRSTGNAVKLKQAKDHSKPGLVIEVTHEITTTSKCLTPVLQALTELKESLDETYFHLAYKSHRQRWQRRRPRINSDYEPHIDSIGIEGYVDTAEESTESEWWRDEEEYSDMKQVMEYMRRQVSLEIARCQSGGADGDRLRTGEFERERVGGSDRLEELERLVGRYTEVNDIISRYVTVTKGGSTGAHFDMGEIARRVDLQMAP